MEINIDIMQDASEIVHYDTLGIPLYMRQGDLTEYPGMRALCHWHEDIEFIRITKGRMYYQINGTKILLNEHDCLIVNSRQMHYGYSVHNENCLFTCILFHPGLLTGNHFMYEKYVLPYLENPDFEFIHFENGNYLHDEISDLLDRIAELKESGFPGFQLEISGYMSVLWARLLKAKLLKPLRTRDTAHTDLTLSRDMVSYVYAHYPDLSLIHI